MTRIIFVVFLNKSGSMKTILQFFNEWFWVYAEIIGIKRPIRIVYVDKCDGCGRAFDHLLHDHWGYRSCSEACDEIIEQAVCE